MKPLPLLILGLLFPFSLLAQSLEGTWNGGLQQDDKTFVYTMEMSLVQDGNSLSGTITCADPETGEYVVEKFRGRLNGTAVSLREYEVIDSYIAPDALFSWCVKLLDGAYVRDPAANQMVLKGTWRSDQVWSPDTRELSPGICAPGKFLLKKTLTKPEPAPLQITVSERIALENVLFVRTKAEILPESYSDLDALYRFLADNPGTHIRLEGHTDRIGSSSKNLILSRRRAEAIRDYLTDKGIERTRIETVGYGDRNILCEPPCKRNRRVEFIITRD